MDQESLSSKNQLNFGSEKYIHMSPLMCLFDDEQLQNYYNLKPSDLFQNYYKLDVENNSTFIIIY